MLPCQGGNLDDAFVGKSQEKKLIDQMKSDFGLIKKSSGYAVSSINDEDVQFSASILDRKMMRKCCIDEVLAPVVSLAHNAAKGSISTRQGTCARNSSTTAAKRKRKERCSIMHSYCL